MNPANPANLGSLPPELVIQVLQDLPVSDILSVCESSRYLSSFCQDWDLWAEKARHEFSFPRDQFTQTYLRLPIQRYLQIKAYHDRPNNFLDRATRSGNLALLEYLLDIGGNPRQILSAIDVAAETGNVAVLHRLLEAFHLPKLDAEGNYDDEELEEWSEWADHGRLFFDDFDDLLKDALELAARHHHVGAVQELIQAGTIDYGPALMAAGLNGYMDIVQLLLHHTPPNKRTRYFSYLLVGAAAGGHLNLVKTAIQAGAINLNDALSSAAGHGQIEMIDYLRQRGADDLNGALLEAARHNQVATIQHLIDSGATNLDGALAAAAYRGQLEAVKFLLRQGATDVNEALELAASASCGSLDVIRTLLQAGATKLNEALAAAACASASRDSLDVIRTLLQAGATKLNEALVAAAWVGNLPIIQELIHAGATNIREAAYVASRSIQASPAVDTYFQSLLETT
jgi:ankyrin repeat protein